MLKMLISLFVLGANSNACSVCVDTVSSVTASAMCPTVMSLFVAALGLVAVALRFRKS